mmetsp:Transcript_6420/g.13683  ORF Transcript_6420/g.13683 Transcript_6420/m.13683 type:complete len:216 (+) Transcript_6420:1299-1946(+)
MSTKSQSTRWLSCSLEGFSVSSLSGAKTRTYLIPRAGLRRLQSQIKRSSFPCFHSFSDHARALGASSLCLSSRRFFPKWSSRSSSKLSLDANPFDAAFWATRLNSKFNFAEDQLHRKCRINHVNATNSFCKKSSVATRVRRFQTSSNFPGNRIGALLLWRSRGLQVERACRDRLGRFRIQLARQSCKTFGCKSSTCTQSRTHDFALRSHERIGDS